MIGKNFPRQAPGHPIAARTINQPSRAMEGVARMRAGGTIAQLEVDGIPLFRPTEPAPLWARITGSPTGSAYPWQGLYAIASGAWADLSVNYSDRSGLDLAYEWNANADVPIGLVVLMYVEPYTRQWIFQFAACS